MDHTTNVVLFCVGVCLLRSSAQSSTTTISPNSTNNPNTTTTTTTTTTTVSPATVQPEACACGGDTGVGRGIGIGVAITLCVVAVVVGGLVLLLWRRGWILPCNSDFSHKQMGNADVGGLVQLSNSKERQERENDGYSHTPGAGNYSSFHSGKENTERLPYESLQRNASVDRGKKTSGRVSRPASDQKRKRSDEKRKSEQDSASDDGDYVDPSDAGRPTSDVYEDPGGSGAGNRDSDYVEPMASPGKGAGEVIMLPERAPPEGKRNSGLEDSEPGEIYQNMEDNDPTSRADKGRGATCDGRSPSNSGNNVNTDELYIDMAGTTESIYMNY